jgi:hypothetical protein
MAVTERAAAESARSLVGSLPLFGGLTTKLGKRKTSRSLGKGVRRT